MLLAADPMITEFQAINVSTIQDEQGDYEDWIEIRNPGTEAITLDGWHLTDDNADREKGTFPDAKLDSSARRASCWCLPRARIRTTWSGTVRAAHQLQTGR